MTRIRFDAAVTQDRFAFAGGQLGSPALVYEDRAVLGVYASDPRVRTWRASAGSRSQKGASLIQVDLLALPGSYQPAGESRLPAYAERARTPCCPRRTASSNGWLVGGETQKLNRVLEASRANVKPP